MPSYRSILSIGLLASGVAPESIEVRAKEAVTASTTLESFGIEIVRGVPRVVIRFTGVDDEEAWEVHERTVAALREIAQIPSVVLAKVVSGRSVPLLRA